MKKIIFPRNGDKLLFAFALAILAVALFRAGSDRVSIVKPPAIVFTHWWEGDLKKDTLRVLSEEFEALHGGIKIILDARSYEDLQQVLFTSAELSPPGDVLALDSLWVSELQKRGSIESSNQLFLSFVNVLYYNVDLLKEAGFSRPPKTRNEFINCARALGRGGSNTGFVLGLGINSSRGIYDDVFPWIWSSGAQLIKDGKPAVSSRQVIESLSFLASLNGEGLIAPDGFSGDSRKKIEDFISGRTAFMIAPGREIKSVREHMGDEAFGVTSVPGPDGYAEMAYYGTAGWTIGVNLSSTHREEARLFADFLSGKVSVLLEDTKAIPGNGASPFIQDPMHLKVWDIAIAGESAQDFTGQPWTELEKIFREELSSLFVKKSSPQEAAAVIQTRWEAVLERFGN
jgi:multiple sugar transport system substrate-binding protein